MNDTKQDDKTMEKHAVLAVNEESVQTPVIGCKRNFAQMKSKSMAENLQQASSPREVVETEEREQEKTEDFMQPLPRA